MKKRKYCPPKPLNSVSILKIAEMCFKRNDEEYRRMAYKDRFAPAIPGFMFHIDKHEEWNNAGIKSITWLPVDQQALETNIYNLEHKLLQIRCSAMKEYRGKK